jgi:hypothetical protein
MGYMFDFSDQKMEARREGFYSLLAGLFATAFLIGSVLHLKIGSDGPKEVKPWMMTVGAAFFAVWFGSSGYSISGPNSCHDPKAKALAITGLCLGAVSLLIIGAQFLFHL